MVNFHSWDHMSDLNSVLARWCTDSSHYKILSPSPISIFVTQKSRSCSPNSSIDCLSHEKYKYVTLCNKSVAMCWCHNMSFMRILMIFVMISWIAINNRVMKSSYRPGPTHRSALFVINALKRRSLDSVPVLIVLMGVCLSMRPVLTYDVGTEDMTADLWDGPALRALPCCIQTTNWLWWSSNAPAAACASHYVLYVSVPSHLWKWLSVCLKL